MRTARYGPGTRGTGEWMGVSHATAEELVRDLFELQRVTRKVLKAAALHLSLIHI